MGDVIGDVLAYWIGYIGRIAVIKKLDHRFGVSEEKIEKLKRLLEKRPGKILLAIKLAPFLPVPGIIAIGSTHLSFKKFMLIDALIVVPKAMFFIFLGYFFGHTYDKIYRYLNNGLYAFLIVLIVASSVYYVYRKISAKISKNLQKD
jgi:membrane protein DedA with SNARE-associated domain